MHTKVEILLEGKSVADNIKKEIEHKMKKLKEKPYVVVLGIQGDDASLAYTKKIEKNCNKYGIKFELKLAQNEEEFLQNFKKAKQNKEITGIMFQQPLKKELFNLINEIPPEKDIEGISFLNIGKLFLDEENVNTAHLISGWHQYILRDTYNRWLPCPIRGVINVKK